MTQLKNGLYPHQVDGIKFLTQHGRAILADDTFGRAGHLQCTCPGFEYRGECKHVREVRKTALAD